MRSEQDIREVLSMFEQVYQESLIMGMTKEECASRLALVTVCEWVLGIDNERTATLTKHCQEVKKLREKYGIEITE